MLKYSENAVAFYTSTGTPRYQPSADIVLDSIDVTLNIAAPVSSLLFGNHAHET